MGENPHHASHTWQLGLFSHNSSVRVGAAGHGVVLHVSSMISNERRSRPNGSTNAQYRKEFALKNSRVVVEDGPALTVRIEHDNRTEWGYVDPQTVEALEEVA